MSLLFYKIPRKQKHFNMAFHTDKEEIGDSLKFIYQNGSRYINGGEGKLYPAFCVICLTDSYEFLQLGNCCVSTFCSKCLDREEIKYKPCPLCNQSLVVCSKVTIYLHKNIQKRH